MMGSGNVHTVINVLGMAALLLIGVRYSNQMSQLIGTTANATTGIFGYASGLAPQGWSVPAAAQ